MPDYRRNYVAGGTFFFTVVTHRRSQFLCRPEARHLFRSCIRTQLRNRPFKIDAVALLPDHLHMMWTLPRHDKDFSTRWSAIKGDFTREWLRQSGSEAQTTSGQRREGRRGVWQPRFIEHTIRDEDDFQSHLDYIHYNPVKHGWARSPKEWRWSSFHRYVRLGAYPIDWGRAAITFQGVDQDLLE
jgi:putative transposase